MEAEQLLMGPHHDRRENKAGFFKKSLRGKNIKKSVWMNFLLLGLASIQIYVSFSH